MSKTAPIHDDIHALIIDKQTELKRKYRITVKISDLIAIYVRHGIDKTEKLLGLKIDEGDTTNDITQGITYPEKPNVGITENVEVKENEVSS